MPDLPVTRLLKRYAEIIKFIIAGGTAFVVNIVALFVFTDIIGIHYLTSTVLAFLVAFIISFVLQKFWTFRDHSSDQLHVQGILYLIMQGVNLGLNALLMYTLVEYLHVYYLFSQVIISFFLAFVSFFINKRYIFGRSQPASTPAAPNTSTPTL
jgi:putative flippase GtrA